MNTEYNIAAEQTEQCNLSVCSSIRSCIALRRIFRIAHESGTDERLENSWHNVALLRPGPFIEIDDWEKRTGHVLDCATKNDCPNSVVAEASIILLAQQKKLRGELYSYSK